MSAKVNRLRRKLVEVVEQANRSLRLFEAAAKLRLGVEVERARKEAHDALILSVERVRRFDGVNHLGIDVSVDMRALSLCKRNRAEFVVYAVSRAVERLADDLVDRGLLVAR